MSPPRLWADPAFRAVAFSNILQRFAMSALRVLLGYQVFSLTRNPMDLAWLGLVEAIPGIGLVLYGGHVADRHDRRAVLLLAAGAMAALAGLAAWASVALVGQVWPLFGIAFLIGAAGAFEDPAAAGLEAQVVPLQALVRGTAVLATSGRLAMVAGPALGGLLYDAAGPGLTYALLAALFAASLVALLPVPSVRPEAHTDEQGTWARIMDGVRYTLRDQLLLGSMLLDLFAVFFGGATALLPAVATEILHVGSSGFGVLRAAPACGSLLAAMAAPYVLPQHRAGLALLWVIGGFGAAIVVFGLSTSLYLSVAALFVAGLCDGLSVVIRRAILRLASPEAMRGRIAAMKAVFVGSSNELGAVESGVAASLIGVGPAIWAGGIVTIGIVLATAALAPRLRRLNLVALTAAPAPPPETGAPAVPRP